MAKKLQQTLSCGLNLTCFLFCLSWLPLNFSSSNELSPITISNLYFPETILRPYGWRYIRVDLPPGFASMSMNLQSNVDIVSMLPHSLQIMLSSTNDSLGDNQARQLVEKCHPLQENIKLLLTNEQISSGVWYIGLFNGFGSVVTQSKMIIRGSDILYSLNISVEGCPTSAIWGQFCNQTVTPLACADMYNQTEENVITCRNSLETSCSGYKLPRGYSLDVTGMVELLKVMAVNASFNEGPINNTRSLSGVLYARYGAMPSGSLHDYASDISKNPLVIQSPKVGRWYISLLPGNQTEGWVPMGDNDIISDPCYSLEWQVQECPVGRGGPNCTWQSHMLQTVIRKSPSVPFESYYLPEKTSLDSSKFLLEPLLSNSSVGDKSEYAWTYFLLEVPRGAAGGHIHIQLKSDTVLDYEIYSRSGGLPSLDTWDYYYANKTSSSTGSVFFKLYESSPKAVSFYILYAKEGTWSFGLRHPVHTRGLRETSTLMSIASERCPKGCSSPHGTCQNVLDASGLTLYSYCFCDRDHGGFDCSIEIVSRQGHIWQSIALIASNGAAILPAFWTLRQKAFAEWVLFTSSGISSALYHACDVGTWCVLSFRVLQFLDFWLSFMAVVSTFVYLTTIDEVSKRVIHTIVAILTAILAVSGATRSSNIIIVIAIGALGLVIGWLIEYSTTIRSFSFSTMLSLNISERWQRMKDRVYNFIKTLRSRFRWWYILAGFVVLSLAGLSWKLETDQSYWIWHSLWHVTIYTSSFFFLCSKVAAVDRSTGEVAAVDRSTGEGQNVVYELTRQDSLSRV